MKIKHEQHDPAGNFHGVIKSQILVLNRAVDSL